MWKVIDIIGRFLELIAIMVVQLTILVKLIHTFNGSLGIFGQPIEWYVFWAIIFLLSAAWDHQHKLLSEKIKELE